MILETISVGPLQANCYILACADSRKALIIDPGSQAGKIKSVLRKHRLEAGLIVNTHGHYDHIGADDEFGVDVYVHERDLEMLRDARKNLSAAFSSPVEVVSAIKPLADKQLIRMDCLEMEVLHLPGHSPGGIGLLMNKPQGGIIFTGDTLFCRGVGRCDLPGGDALLLEKSIRDRLFSLPDETKVYPGHGPSTTIGAEKEDAAF